MNYKLINPINPQYQAIEQVLHNRGISDEDIKSFITPHPIEHDPELLMNIKEAAALLIKHIGLDNSHIHVQVDKLHCPR